MRFTLLVSVVAICSAFRVHKGVKETSVSHVNATQGKWVTLGDSYASGAGIHTAHRDYAGGMGGCYRDFTLVPGAKYAQANGLLFVQKACAGQRIRGVEATLNQAIAEHPEEAANEWEGSIFQVNAGGNDLRTGRDEGWEPLLLRCVLTLTQCSTYEDNQVVNFDEVQAELEALYTRLATVAGKAKIRITGYPRLMQHSGWCWGVPGIYGSECHWMDRMVDDFNARISLAVDAAKAAVPGADMEFIDITGAITVGSCGWSNRHISGVVLSFSEGGLPSPATLHPQQRGYDAVGEAIFRTL